KRAEQVLNRIEVMGETMYGLSFEDLLRLPDRRFFRFRGLKEFADYRERDPVTGRLGYVYLPYDADGHMLMHDERPVEREVYVDYLKTMLPERLRRSRYWSFVKEEFLFNLEWSDGEMISGG
ncbi:MAG: hypothetical protein V3U52_03680, partial [Thermoplasmata archaeon]